MEIVACTHSLSWRKHLSAAVDQPIRFIEQLDAMSIQSSVIYLLHHSRSDDSVFSWLKRNAAGGDFKVAICADRPDVQEMLESVKLGAKAYCNSHMQAAHFQQMLRLLEAAHSWFAPDLLQKTFDIAQSALTGKDVDQLLSDLTERESQIAKAVAQGHSNAKIAGQLSISEATVKTHLTRIFKKLDLKDRVTLALLLS